MAQVAGSGTPPAAIDTRSSRTPTLSPPALAKLRLYAPLVVGVKLSVRVEKASAEARL